MTLRLQDRTRTAVRVSGVIAVVRVGLFWGALVLYTGNSDWRQAAGYVVLILNSVVELAIAAAVTGHHPGPSLLVAGLIVLTSAIVGWMWALTR